MIRRLLLPLILCVAVPRVVADCPEEGEGESHRVPNQFIIGVATYADPNDAFAMINSYWPGTIVIASIPSRNIYLMQPPALSVDCDIVAALLNSLVNPFPLIVNPNRPLNFAELNYEDAPPEGQTGTIFIKTPPAQGLADYENQYPVQKLGLPPALARSTGRGTVVAVIDTGVDASHVLLAGHVLPGYNFITDSTDTSDLPLGTDSNNNGLYDEMSGHGTYMAGIVALVAPEAKILPVVVLDSDGGSDQFKLAQGIYYAIDHGVEVINLSLGSTDNSDLVEDALKEAQSHGIVLVAAAGNRNASSPKEYPAAAEGVIGVAATDIDDLKAPFSSYYSSLSLSAPGQSVFLPGGDPDPNAAIYSTVPGGDEQTLASWEGTSISTAFVSGAAALVRAQHPEWRPSQDTSDSVWHVLRNSAVFIDDLNPAYAGMLGEGRLDVAAAVAAGPPMPEPGDLNGDGVVGLSDLAALLTDYGKVHSSADLDSDGIVGFPDLVILLSAFGT